MKTLKTLVILISLISLAASCTPAVRFSSKTKTNYGTKKYAASNSQPINKSHSISKISIKPENANPHDLRTAIVNEAVNWIGTPYCYGGESKSCTDCSGFVLSVFSGFGIQLPRTAAKQFGHVMRIDQSEATAADLVFFNTSSGVSHVGIVIGPEQFIHASSSNGVTLQQIDSWWSSRLIGFGRILH